MGVWLVPVGLLGCGLCYLILELVVVRWSCRTFLSGRVQLLEDQKKRDGASTGGKIIARRDIIEISLLVLTWIMGAATSAVSIIIMLETRHDTLHARSTLLIPWCHMAAPYYIIDTYAMLAAFMTQDYIVHRKIRTKLLMFVQKKWPFLLHHLIIAISYPIIVNDHIRGYKGDFYVAALLAQDLSNPLLANAKILHILGLTDNVFYAMNGGFLVLVFLASRVMFVPSSIAIYAAQYHQWDVMQALGTMKRVCHLGNALQFSFQLYWFVLLLRLSASVVRGWAANENGSSAASVVRGRGWAKGRSERT